MDRNAQTSLMEYEVPASLSARRAWIEISDIDDKFGGLMVALRKESVDRNDTVQIVVVVMHASLSARRAWIEILFGRC